MIDLSLAHLIAQTAAVLFPALWLTIGVLDNLRHPRINEEVTAAVLSMSRMAVEYPEAYAQVSHRRIKSRALQQFVFRLAVVWEALATLALWLAFGWLVAALTGSADREGARAAAILAVLLFTSIWAMFLIIGNYFSYWLCHEGAQHTHYQMLLWGLATVLLLMV